MLETLEVYKTDQHPDHTLTYFLRLSVDGKKKQYEVLLRHSVPHPHGGTVDQNIIYKIFDGEQSSKNFFNQVKNMFTEYSLGLK